MLLEISAFIAAMAFVVLVVFLIQTLRTAKTSLDRATSTLEDLQQTIHVLNGDLQGIVKHANQVTADVELQLKKINPLMNSVENTGEALQELTSAAKQVSVGLMQGVRKAASRYERPASTSNSANSHATEPLHTTYGTERSDEEPVANHQHAQHKPNPERWKLWVDIGFQAWQMYRSRS